MRPAFVIGLVALVLGPGASAGSPRSSPGVTVGGPGFWAHQGAPADSVLLGDVITGGSCSFAVTHDMTGIVIMDPTKQTGEFTCGPITMVNLSGGTINSVTVTGCIKVNDASYGGGVCRSATTSGSAGFLFDTLSFNALPGDDVYYCTTVSWSSSKGGGSVNFDGDDITAGDQCTLSTSIEA